LTEEGIEKCGSACVIFAALRMPVYSPAFVRSRKGVCGRKSPAAENWDSIPDFIRDGLASFRGPARCGVCASLEMEVIL